MEDQHRDPAPGLKRDYFDLKRGNLTGLVGALHSRPSTVQSTEGLTGITQTFIVQTTRHYDEGSADDWVFVQFIGSDGAHRYVLPPKVCDVIARQRAKLIERAASRRGKDQAAARGNPFANLSPAKRKAARAKALTTRRAKAKVKAARAARST